MKALPLAPRPEVANWPGGVAAGARGHPATLGLFRRHRAGVQPSPCPRRSGRTAPPTTTPTPPASPLPYSRSAAPCVRPALRPQPFSPPRSPIGQRLPRPRWARPRVSLALAWGRGRRAARFPLSVVQAVASRVGESEVAPAMWSTLRYLGGACGPARCRSAGDFLRASGPTSGGPRLLRGGRRSSSTR